MLPVAGGSVAPGSSSAPTIYTTGHSTRPIETLIAMLRAFGIELVVDVRTAPRSRRNPQYGQEALAQSLGAAGIRYLAMSSLGGWRRARASSPNTGWRNAGFRGYADYMLTDEFQHAVEELIALAREQRTAILCAEAVPWRCHRWLIADALVVRGVRVEHIMNETRAQAHRVTPWARVCGTRISYPGPE